MQAMSSIVVLLNNDVDLMQMTLIGTLLVNLLLLPALSIFYATYHRKSMVHEYAVTKKYSLLLYLATAGFVVPTMFDLQTTLPVASTAGASRGTSILLILTYGAYLFFQLSTHKSFFEHDLPFKHYPIPSSETREWVAGGLHRISTPQQRENEPQELSIWTASVLFIITTALIYFSVDNFVDSVLDMGMLSNYFGFSGYILIPVLNSDVAAFEQIEQSMDIVLSFTLEKSLQFSLFFSPFLVLVAWGLGIDAAGLSFDVLGVTALLTSVYLVNTLAALGNFNWSVNTMFSNNVLVHSYTSSGEVTLIITQMAGFME